MSRSRTLVVFAAITLFVRRRTRTQSRTRHVQTKAFLSTTGILLLSSTSFALGQATFQSLGDLPGGPFDSRAAAVSADHLVVAGKSRYGGSSESEAFRWTAVTGMVGLGFLAGGTFSEALAMSNDGSIVVGQSFSSLGLDGFRWNSTDGMVGIGDLPGGSFLGTAIASSSDASVIAGRSSSTNSGTSNFEAYRWTQATGMVGLGDISGGPFDSVARGISADGSVIVGYGTASSGFRQAFRWTETDGMVGLGALSGGISRSEAHAVSADGTTVVGGSNSSNNLGSQPDEAFLWTQATGMVGLGDLPGGNFWSKALGVSENGSVIVGVGNILSDIEAFIWDPSNGIRNLRGVLINDFGLDLTGWTLETATAISPDGLAIVGIGTNPDGNTEAWLVTLPAAECGDGIVEGDEECDDGGIDTPTCDFDCTSAVCGDGHINTAAGEACDTVGVRGGLVCHQCQLSDPLPAVSEWGLVVMGLLGLTIGTVLYGRRRIPAASAR